MTATSFKERYANHTLSFRHKKDSNKTELSELWKFGQQSGLYHQMVNFKTRYFVHRGIKTLHLCLEEKFCILKDIYNQRQFTQ
jgi:hypothetical protein